ISQGDSRPTATHIPLELDKNENGKDILAGHISRGNPQWKFFTDQLRVLAVFPGPHTYISSSWYDHENVPTWNYIAVHVYGTIRTIEGEALLAHLKELVDQYEKHSPKPVSVERMTPQFLANEMRGVVAFELLITKMEGAYKL